MVDQRHDVICRLAVAEAARPGMATARLTLTEASPVCVTARIERWSLPRAPDVPMRRRADAGRASTLIRGTGTGGRAGTLARSGRCVAAGLLLAFATLLALPLQAQTVWTSNLGQTKAVVYTTTQPYTVTRAAAAPPGTVLVGNFDAGADAYPSRTQRVAQRFTTGANASGYTLTSVEVESADRQRDTFSAKVCTVTGSDQPTSTCTDLTAPTRFALGNIVFTVAGGMTLSTRTNYTVVLTPESGKTVTYGAVGNSAEDSNSLSKWIIANEYRFESATSWQVDSYSLSLKIRVRGSENTTTSTDATLSALTVNDGTNDLSLSPAFASGTYAYAANVGNGVTSVTLTATPNHTGGSVTGVTLGGTAIADTDFTNGITVPSLVEGDNVIVVTVTAEDTSTQAYTVTVTRAAASTDAKLSALTVNDGTSDLTLSPAFASGTFTYAANARNGVTSVTLAATPNHTGGSVTGVTLGGTAIADTDFTNGITVPSLVEGDNVIVVTVTAEDTSTQAYTVTVTRAAASTDAKLSALTVNDGTSDLTLSPAFASGTFTYAANVGNGVTSVTLTATPNHTGGSVTGVTLGGTAIADTDFTNGITVPSLVEGDNVVIVTVTAQDITSTQAYTVTVTRAAASTDATLSALTVNDGTSDLTLSPAFASGTLSYTATVANSVDVTTVTATAETGAARTILPVDSESGKIGHQVALGVGDTTITVEVTKSGEATQTYTVVVTRAATSTDATLSALALKDGSTAITLSPGFSSTVTTYTALVANAVDEITIVPEVNESNATYEIQDSGGTALADADDMEDGFQVDLDVGANMIEVEVTAQDTTTMETYTVVATRAAASSLTATLESPDYVVVENLQYRFDLKLTEAVAIPNRDVRDHAFSVTNGRMVRAQRIDKSAGGSNHWRMTVEPYDETKLVTVTLRGNRACSEQGALCTGGGDQVANSPTLTLSAETLTLDSSNLPRVSIENATAKENDAWLNFIVRLSRAAAQTVAVDFKTVSGGTATEGADYRAQDYRVIFTPGKRSVEAGVALIADTVNDVGETVKAEIANARVITARGAELGPLTIAAAQATGTIDAPATSTTDVSNLTIRIDDTTGDEDDGWLNFRVSLSRAYTEYVCFDFETLTTGTATEGTDYGKRPKVNDWIRPGATQTTAFVRIFDDSVSDSGETVKVRIGNARLCNDASKTVTIANAEATGTITNSDHIPQAWLARFGRTVADQVIDAVDGRLGAARRPGVEATLAGRSIGGAPEGDGTRQSMAEETEARARLEAVTSWLRGGTGDSRAGLFGSRVVSERDLLAATAFSMTGQAEGGGSIAVWGRGAIASFDGRESRLSVDGEVANVMLGADWSGGALTAGLMLSHARGSGSYRGESDGKVESTLTGIYPYGRYAASERVTVWGVAGYGAGGLTLKQEDDAAKETDMDLMMAAVGLRGVVVEAPESGGPELAVKSDAMVVRTTSDAVQGLEAATAEVTRLRLGLEGSWRVVAGGGGEFVPRLGMGVRHDGGDAETGFGVDIGGGLAWSDRARGITAEVSGRGLLTHASSGFREHGFAGSVSWDPTPDSERGLKLTLRQAVGAEAKGGVDALLSRGTMAGLAANDNGDAFRQRRLEVRLGYGLPAFADRFTTTPEFGFGLSETHREYSLGWRLGLAQGDPGALELRLEGRRSKAANGNREPEHAVGFRMTARW